MNVSMVKRILVVCLLFVPFLPDLYMKKKVEAATVQNGTLMQYFEWYVPNDGPISYKWGFCFNICSAVRLFILHSLIF